MSAQTWSGPADLANQVERLWKNGRLLSAVVTGEDLFPLVLRLRRPSPGDLSDRFDEVRTWIRALEQGAKPSRGVGYEIVWEDTMNRGVGRNTVPKGATIATQVDALALIGVSAQQLAFDAILSDTRTRLPSLLAWLARKPHSALAHAPHWSQILDVLQWFVGHPRCGLYLRQLDIAGVDTKFIEGNRTLIAELLDIVLPPEVLDPSASGSRRFEARYGLREKPATIRMRVLDPAHRVAGFSDLCVPIAELAGFESPFTHMFITENEINGLSFPAARSAAVIFGLGYAIDMLSAVPWLGRCALTYWGDIDTHGFAMLDRLRIAFPQARSMLMDRDTLFAHRALWTVEPAPILAPLPRLTAPETELYDDLRLNRHGASVRLEQERIAFHAVDKAVSTMLR